MMYCVNCEYPVTRLEVDNRKCNNCGNDPAHEAPKAATKCDRCDGDGKAHGSDRPFEYSGPDSYPGKCPVCKGSGTV